MTLAELLAAADAEAKAEFDAVQSKADEFEKIKGKHKESLAEAHSAKALVKQLQESMAELGDIEGLKKIKSMFEQNEELKLFAEGKHDEVFSKRTEKLKNEHQKQLDAILAEKEQALQRSKAFESRVLESKIMNAALQVKSLNPDYMEDILLHARNKFSLNDEGEAVLVQDGQVVLGKDGKSAYSPLEWLSDTDTTGRWHKPTSTGAGAPGNGGNRQQKQDLSHLPPEQRLNVLYANTGAT